MDNRYRLLLPVSVLFALIYLLVPFQEGSLPYIGSKTLTCLLLAAYAFLALPKGRLQKTVTLALIISSLGDFFLAIRSADYFVEGLGSFLIAHLIYISAFARHRDIGSKAPHVLPLTLIIGLLAIVMMTILWPHLGALKAPVCLYIIVISLMAIAAVHSRFQSALIIPGVLSFLISDGLIAVSKFLTPLPFSASMIWITYVTAQVLIVLAVTRNRSPAS